MAQSQDHEREPPLSPTLSTTYSKTNHLPPPLTPTTAAIPTAPYIANDRLSLPFALRLPLTTSLAFTTGFFLGAAHGGQTAALRFRAENAHRLPTSQVGWYLYHKSKNYVTMLGGIKEGFKMGVRVGGWTGVFFAVEEAVDRLRGQFVKSVYGFRERRREEKARRTGVWEEDEVHELDRVMGLERMGGGNRGPVVWVQRDFLSTVVAALGTAGAFSAWNRFPVETAARTALLGLKVGAGFGLVQDLLGFMRGRRLGYVEFVKRHLFGKGEKLDKPLPA